MAAAAAAAAAATIVQSTYARVGVPSSAEGGRGGMGMVE